MVISLPTATGEKTPLPNSGEIVDALYSLHQPQNSMPDVEVWMLSGSKRIAYYRVPAADVLYSPNEDACGKDNGNILDILLKVKRISLPLPLCYYYYYDH